MNKFTKTKLAVALHTASQWHGDSKPGDRALLSLSSTRCVHSEDHRDVLLCQIYRDLSWVVSCEPEDMYDGGFKEWKRDLIRLANLMEVVRVCDVGVEWLSDDENMRINERLYQQQLL